MEGHKHHQPDFDRLHSDEEEEEEQQ
jgi:hypothetical protein